MIKNAILLALVFVVSACADGRRFDETVQNPKVAKKVEPTPEPTVKPAVETELAVVCNVKDVQKNSVKIGPVVPSKLELKDGVLTYTKTVRPNANKNDTLDYEITFPEYAQARPSLRQVVIKALVAYSGERDYEVERALVMAELPLVEGAKTILQSAWDYSWTCEVVAVK